MGIGPGPAFALPPGQMFGSARARKNEPAAQRAFNRAATAHARVYELHVARIRRLTCNKSSPAVCLSNVAWLNTFPN